MTMWSSKLTIFWLFFFLFSLHTTQLLFLLLLLLLLLPLSHHCQNVSHSVTLEGCAKKRRNINAKGACLKTVSPLLFPTKMQYPNDCISFLISTKGTVSFISLLISISNEETISKRPYLPSYFQ